MVKRGDWNHAIGVLGVPGTGKSTHALARAVELGKTPAYVFAHDPGYRLPEKLPSGERVKLARYDSADQCAAAIAKDASGVHAIATVDAIDVVKLAQKVARASLAQGGGERGVPAVVLVDEIVSAADATPHRLGEEMRQLLALRRHQHVAVVWTSQSPQLAHYQLLSLSTEIVCFRLTDERALRRLVQAGVPEEVAAKLRELPNYHSITVRLDGSAPETSKPLDS